MGSIAFKIALAVQIILTPFAVAKAADAPLVESTEAASRQQAIGTVSYWWTDEARHDPILPGARQPRQVAVQIFYPADAADGASLAPYVFDFADLQAPFADYGIFSDWLAAQGENAIFETGSGIRLSPDVSDARETYPVVLLSSGTGMTRAFYTSLASRLVNRAYIVVILDHPGVSLTAVPGRSVVETFEPMTHPPEGLRNRPETERDTFWMPRNDMLAADQLFAIRQLARINDGTLVGPLDGSLNLDRLALGGHSSGFQSRSCEMSRAIACVSLEGVAVLLDRENGLTKPFVNFRDGRDSDAQTSIYRNMQSDAYDILMNGSTHNSSADIGFFSAETAARAHRFMDVISDYMIDFLDHYLKGQPLDLLADSENAPEGVVVTRYSGRVD